jgi:hypothetical protein
MEFLTIGEIARVLKTSPGFVYKDGKLFGGIKVGRLVRFPKWATAALLEDTLDV